MGFPHTRYKNSYNQKHLLEYFCNQRGSSAASGIRSLMSFRIIALSVSFSSAAFCLRLHCQSINCRFCKNVGVRVYAAQKGSEDDRNTYPPSIDMVILFTLVRLMTSMLLRWTFARLGFVEVSSIDSTSPKLHRWSPLINDQACHHFCVRLVLFAWGIRLQKKNPKS